MLINTQGSSRPIGMTRCWMVNISFKSYAENTHISSGLLNVRENLITLRQRWNVNVSKKNHNFCGDKKIPYGKQYKKTCEHEIINI